MEKIKKNTKERGITLIALVITVIVLLLLAGISIAMLSGENSILTQAGRARDLTGEKSTAEKVQLAYSGAVANGQGTVTEPLMIAELDKYFSTYTLDLNNEKVKIDGKNYSFDGTVTPGGNPPGGGGNTHTETINGIEISVPIPSGFTKSTVAGETSVATGLVIKDNTQIQNEYVWIPVFEYDSTKCTWGADYTNVRSATECSSEYYTAIETALKNYTSIYDKDDNKDAWYGDGNYGGYGYYDGTQYVYYTNGNMTESEYIQLYHGMLKSVYENGGFYIGRYEMGIAVVDSATDAGTNARKTITEYTPSTAGSASTNNTALTSAVSISGMTAPLSKQNAVAYSNITQSQAEMLAEMLNYTGVTSSLMFGVQWDMVCVYLEHFGKIDSSATASPGTSFTSSYLTSNDYSKLWGNYKNATFVMNRGFYSPATSTWKAHTSNSKGTTKEWLCTTGASDQNKACNIYDFAGNLYEFTLERHDSTYQSVVSRGGYCTYSKFAGDSGNHATVNGSSNGSARTSLYIGSPES